MKTLTAALCAASLCVLTANPAAAQDAKKTQAPAAAPQGMPPMPKPGPEHEILKKDLGTWDAKVESFAPGQPPAVSKGTETNSMGPGGLWLLTDFKADMMGTAFQGHGASGWDPAKKKYVTTWVDSMSTGLYVGEAGYDAATKSMTGWMEGPDQTGKVTKSKTVSEWKDANTRIFSMYNKTPDGKEVLGMRITYTRRPY